MKGKDKVKSYIRKLLDQGFEPADIEIILVGETLRKLRQIPLYREMEELERKKHSRKGVAGRGAINEYDQDIKKYLLHHTKTSYEGFMQWYYAKKQKQYPTLSKGTYYNRKKQILKDLKD